MFRRSRFALLAIALNFAMAAALAAPAPTAKEVHPITRGQEIPDVQVQNRAGETVDLRAVLAGRPAAIIFYRGGW